MSWNGESRAIKEALRSEHRIDYEICPLCNVNKAHVDSKSEKYNRVTIICMACAQEWIGKYKDTDAIPADAIHEFLYCDNKPMTNYRSKEVEQMRLPL